MKSRGFILFLVSLFFFLLTFLLSFIFTFNDTDVVVLGITGALSIGTSLSGLIIGFFDIPGKKKWIAISGNLLMIAILMTIILWNYEDKKQEPPELSDQVLYEKVREHFGEGYAHLSFQFDTDSVQLGQKLILTYWLEGNDKFYDVAEELGCSFRKEFYYNFSFEDAQGVVEDNTDTVVLRLRLKNSKGLSFDYVKKEAEIGVKLLFESGDFKYDSTFIRAIQYYEKKSVQEM